METRSICQCLIFSFPTEESLTAPEALHSTPISSRTKIALLKSVLAQRGLLKPGYYADLVAFRSGVIDSPAGYESPELDPIGIEFVYRNGRATSFSN